MYLTLRKKEILTAPEKLLCSFPEDTHVIEHQSHDQFL